MPETRKGVAEILPNSIPVQARETKWDKEFGWVIRIYCANCGRKGGWVPEQSMKFLFWICDEGCADKYGAIAGTMCVPDSVFWENLKQEQLEKYGRELTMEELVKVAASDVTPLATLIKQGGL